MKKLHDERAALELARAAAEEREARGAERAARLDAELEAAQEPREEDALGGGAELMERLRRAREDLRDARARAPRHGRWTPRGCARRSAQSSASPARWPSAVRSGAWWPASIGRRAPREPRAGARPPRRAARVWVPRLRAEAEVVEVLDDGAVRVAARASEAHGAGGRAASAAPRRLRHAPPVRVHLGLGAGRRAPAAIAEAAPIQTHDNTCDLRGLRVDDGVGHGDELSRSRDRGRRSPSCSSCTAMAPGRWGTPSARSWRAPPTSPAFAAASPIRAESGVTLVWLN